MEIKVTPNNFILTFAYRPSLIEAVKRLPERRFNPSNKTWTVPSAYRREVEIFAHRWGFRWGEVTNKPEQDYTISALPELTIDIPLKMTLRHYQRGGVAYNLQHKKVIIGDDMGLGKTGQAIATIVGADILFQQTGQNPAFPCLVICPSSVKYNWLDQWLKWTGRNFAMILGNANKRNWQLYLTSNMAKILIVNYESLKKYFVISIEEHIDKVTGKKKPLRLDYIHFNEHIKIFNSVIIDECHRVKDTKTMQTKFTKGIAHGKKWILGLTGTPVVNKPKDLISQLGIIDTMGYFGGYKGFIDEFCQGEREASNLKKLNWLLNKHCFYRRSKQEVATELPPKSRQVILCDITNRKEYEAAEGDLVNYLQSYKDATDDNIRKSMKGKALFQISVLKNISARGKLKDVKEYIDDVIESGEKVGIFVHLKEVANVMKAHYPHSATITGDDKLIDRQNAIKRFKDNDNCMTAILSIMAAGTGVDGLQYACSLACFVEQPWTAAACDQAEDRFNRIGQTKPVQIIYFLGRNTIDEHIYSIIQTKRDISNTITGNTDDIETSMINDIMNIFNKK
jgi:SWI/SNF-related matrix-associated actin-dependent regulator 1 of chromatin subfamily A